MICRNFGWFNWGSLFKFFFLVMLLWYTIYNIYFSYPPAFDILVKLKRNQFPLCLIFKMKVKQSVPPTPIMLIVTLGNHHSKSEVFMENNKSPAKCVGYAKNPCEWEEFSKDTRDAFCCLTRRQPSAQVMGKQVMGKTYKGKGKATFTH